MVYQPRTQDTIYESLKSRLTGKIAKLTNFTETSFNYVWIHDAFSGYLHEYEISLLAAQLSGWIEYAGGPVTQEDLDKLGIDDVEPEQVNAYMKDQDLDEMGYLMGVSRDQGNKSTGEVQFTVSSDSTVVKKGTRVGTQPDFDGNYLLFHTTEEVTPATGATTVTAPIIADEIGTEYNVGSGHITFFPNRPPGVSDVTNPGATEGGENVESNSSLRTRIKNAVVNESGGGTVHGIEGYIKSHVAQVRDVEVKEYHNQDPPYADVIVDGGDQQAVLDAIDISKPSAVKHNLVRPTTYNINVTATLVGTAIDYTGAELVVTNYLSDLKLNDDVYNDKIVQRVMNSDENIDEISALDIAVDREPHTFSSTVSVYTVNKELRYTQGEDVTEVIDDAGTTYVKGTDFTVVDNDADGNNDSIDFSIGGASPADGQEFYITYNVEDNVVIGAQEIGDPNEIVMQ